MYQMMSSFKVNYKKIYDLISYELLIYMLGRMRLNKNWMNWIKECLRLKYNINFNKWESNDKS